MKIKSLLSNSLRYSAADWYNLGGYPIFARKFIHPAWKSTGN